jgi:hypothetical protein
VSTPEVRLSFVKVAALPGTGRPAVDSLGRAVIAGGRGIQVFEGDAWRRLAFASDASLPGRVEVAERLSTDSWLLAATSSPRCDDGSGVPNAMVITESGVETVRFSIGDGVEDVQAGPEGDIWVSYQSLGTMGDYGRNGWGRLSPVLWIEPIGGSGLARFDLAGNKTYDFTPPPDDLPVMDAYALNVGRDCTWLVYHPGFNLVRLDSWGEVRVWKSPVWGVDAVAVAGDRVLMHRLGWPEHAWVVGKLGPGSELDEIVPASIDLRGYEGQLQRVVGRGSYMHLFTAAAWYRLDFSASC